MTCSVKNHIKYYIFNLLKLFIFKREGTIRTTPDNSWYMTIMPQYAEGNHYYAANGELLRFGNTVYFYFQSDSFFVTK